VIFVFRADGSVDTKCKTGMGLSNSFDRDEDSRLPRDHHSQAVDEQLQRTSRRRFTRNGIVGSAVIFSLGNRAAWGRPVTGTCVSPVVWASWTAPNGGFSAHPGHGEDTPLQLEKMDAELIEHASEGAQVVDKNIKGETKSCVVWDEAPGGLQEPLSTTTSDKTTTQQNLLY
jgi:hypothetical protein